MRYRGVLMYLNLNRLELSRVHRLLMKKKNTLKTSFNLLSSTQERKIDDNGKINQDTGKKTVYFSDEYRFALMREKN